MIHSSLRYNIIYDFYTHIYNIYIFFFIYIRSINPSTPKFHITKTCRSVSRFLKSADRSDFPSNLIDLAAVRCYHCRLHWPFSPLTFSLSLFLSLVTFLCFVVVIVVSSLIHARQLSAPRTRILFAINLAISHRHSHRIVHSSESGFGEHIASDDFGQAQSKTWNNGGRGGDRYQEVIIKAH